MSLSDTIPRDQDFHSHDGATTFDPINNPADRVMMQEFGVAVPTSELLLSRDVTDLPPEGLEVTHRLNLLIPELVAGVVGVLPTPDRVAPNRTFARQGLHAHEIIVYPVRTGGNPTVVEVWPFMDTASGAVTWPSPAIRAVEGEVCHTRMNNAGGPHTIHHHGIEPTPFNDGVGKLSMEVSGPDYVYQWQANEAGTYFYHCHRNTVLHFEMGMYGMLLVDPPAPAGSGLTAPYALGGAGFIRRRSELVRYDKEAIWVPDDLDPFWRTFNRAHGIADPGLPADPQFFYHSSWDGVLNGAFDPLNGRNTPGLHLFNPQYFVISGVASPWTMPAGTPGVPPRPAIGSTVDGRRVGDQLPPIPADGVAVRVTQGERLLVRLLNASYTTLRATLPLDAEVVSMDGHTLGHGARSQYSEPFTVPGGSPFILSTARRWDLLIDTAGVAPGTYEVTLEFRNWTTNELFHTARTAIIVQ